jgi:hypothetical protein
LAEIASSPVIRAILPPALVGKANAAHTQERGLAQFTARLTEAFKDAMLQWGVLLMPTGLLLFLLACAAQWRWLGSAQTYDGVQVGALKMKATSSAEQQATEQGGEAHTKRDLVCHVSLKDHRQRQESHSCSVRRLSSLAASTYTRAALLVGLTFVVLFLRRPDQFLHPYIWDEDGTIILKAYLAHGLSSITEPVGGFYVLATKLLTLTSFKLSFVWAPYLAVYLTTAFTCMVIAAIAFSPTHLAAPFLCAVAVLLVPTDAEVFAVSEYGFWWAGLLLIVALLWDTAPARHQWLRLIYIIIGGLSSPIVAITAGLLTIRAALERRASEYWAAGLAVACAALQSWSVYSTNYAAAAAEQMPP